MPAELEEYDIARTMRMITAMGFAEETAYQTYKANIATHSQDSSGSRGGLIISWVTALPDE